MRKSLALTYHRLRGRFRGYIILIQIDSLYQYFNFGKQYSYGIINFFFSGIKLGTKRILGSLSSMFGKVNSLLLKVVATIFPWNRRARRRLANIGEDDEEL